jgi:hypothetical protein
VEMAVRKHRHRKAAAETLATIRNKMRIFYFILIFIFPLMSLGQKINFEKTAVKFFIDSLVNNIEYDGNLVLIDKYTTESYWNMFYFNIIGYPLKQTDSLMIEKFNKKVLTENDSLYEIADEKYCPDSNKVYTVPSRQMGKFIDSKNKINLNETARVNVKQRIPLLRKGWITFDKTESIHFKYNLLISNHKKIDSIIVVPMRLWNLCNLNMSYDIFVFFDSNGKILEYYSFRLDKHKNYENK